jgi:hypothetical protein
MSMITVIIIGITFLYLVGLILLAYSIAEKTTIKELFKLFVIYIVVFVNVLISIILYVAN